MEDLSDIFKRGMQALHMKNSGKTLQERCDTHKDVRRATRNALMFQKRNIDENMSPYNTPEPTRKKAENVRQKPELPRQRLLSEQEMQPSRARLELLAKWKAEKQKLKDDMSKKSKPIFKVYHVPPDILAKTNAGESKNNICKGKSTVQAKPQFAPVGHTFKAPKNIKAINFTKNTSYRSAVPRNVKGTPLQTKKQSEKPLEKLKKELASNILNGQRKPIVLLNEVKSSETTKGHMKDSKSRANVSKDKADGSLNKSNPKQVAANITNKTKRGNTSQTEPKITRSKSPIKNLKSTPTKNLKKSPMKSLKNTPAKIFKSTSTKNLKVTPPKTLKCTPTKNLKATPAKSLKKTPVKSLQTSPNKSSKNTPAKSLKPASNSDKAVENENSNLATNKDSNKKLSKINPQAKISSPKPSNTRLTPQPRKRTKPNTASSVSSKAVGFSGIGPESDDEVFTSEIKTPVQRKQKYRKTPKKPSGSTSSVSPIQDKNNSDALSKGCHSPRSSDITIISISSSDCPRSLITSISSSECPRSPKNSASPDYPLEISTTTPPKSTGEVQNPSVYISPFVTVSRGKDRARMEYRVRRSEVGVDAVTPEVSNIIKSISKYTSPQAGANYFNKKLNDEIKRIENVCDEWQKIKDDPEIPEESHDMIDVAIGQSKLLISKKFQQFRDLINKCRSSNGEDKPVTCEDLHGFWDMMYIQVIDLEKRFDNLKNLKDNNWQEILPEKKAALPKKRGRPKKNLAASSKLKDLIKAARSKKKSQEDDIPTVNIESPVPESVPEISKPSRQSTGRNLRISLLAQQNQRRASSSPGLMMMKITQTIKQGDGLTPCKSILKTADSVKSKGRSSKSVLFVEDIARKSLTKVRLFNDEEEDKSDKENDTNVENTPVRRSVRLRQK